MLEHKRLNYFLLRNAYMITILPKKKKKCMLEKEKEKRN